MGIPPPFFCKYVILGHFKSFVLKVCETKGFADAFFGKCVKRKSLGAMCGLLGICDRSFGSLRSLRTTILVGWSFWPRLPFGVPDPGLSFFPAAGSLAALFCGVYLAASRRLQQ